MFPKWGTERKYIEIKINNSQEPLWLIISMKPWGSWAPVPKWAAINSCLTKNISLKGRHKQIRAWDKFLNWGLLRKISFLKVSIFVGLQLNRAAYLLVNRNKQV